MKDYKDYKHRSGVRKKPSGKMLMPGLFKAGMILAAIFALTFAVKYSHRRLRTSSYFALREIVVSGEKRVKREEIMILSGVKAGESILGLDLRSVAEKIERQPWVERATARRVLPAGLSIDIKEREPFAILKNSGTLFYLDRGGSPFKGLDDGEEAGYPIVTGLGKDEVETDEAARDSLLKALDFIGNEMKEWPADVAISEIRVDKNQGITITSDGMEVKIGFGEYKLKMGRFKRVLDDLRARGRTAGYIDLTYTGQVVIS